MGIHKQTSLSEKRARETAEKQLPVDVQTLGGQIVTERLETMKAKQTTTNLGMTLTQERLETLKAKQAQAAFGAFAVQQRLEFLRR